MTKSSLFILILAHWLHLFYPITFIEILLLLICFTMLLESLLAA